MVYIIPRRLIYHYGQSDSSKDHYKGGYSTRKKLHSLTQQPLDSVICTRQTLGLLDSDQSSSTLTNVLQGTHTLPAQISVCTQFIKPSIHPQIGNQGAEYKVGQLM